MIANSNKPSADLEAFREKLKEYRQLAGYSQKAIAEKLGLHKVVLSNKLNGTPRYNLTIPEVKQIILTLAEWEAILTQKEARELVALAGLPANLFSEAEWQAAPLNQLEVASANPPATQVANATTTSSEPTPLYNLPAQLTELIGRKEELSKTQALIQQPQTRLLILTGTGGVGKTRLAIQLGENLVTDFREGVIFVALAALSDPDLVVAAIAQNLKLAGQPNLDNLKKYLKTKQLLLILDNFEHLTPAAQCLPILLETAPQLKIIVTSRVVLHLPGEQLFEVPPLAVKRLQAQEDALAASPSFTELSQNEAIQLFAQRIRALNPNFTLTFETAKVIGQICYKLEGLPLALELAAARTRLFSLPAILERLSIGLLVTGSRTGLAHHQTLQATLDWSYRLLEPLEKELFTQLAIFPGEFSLEAVTTICLLDETQPEIISQLINSLKDKSLVKEAAVNQEIVNNPNTTHQETMRFGMLETLKEYGLAQLKKLEQKQALKQRYLGYYVNLVEKASDGLPGNQQVYWLAQLNLELPNLRKALKLAQELAQIDTILRLTGALGRFWWMCGYLTEGQYWLEIALAAAKTSFLSNQAELKVKSLWGLGVILKQLGDYPYAIKIYEETLELAKNLGDTSASASAIYNLGIVYFYQSKYKESMAFLEEGLTLHRQLEDKRMIGACLNALGAIALQQGDLSQSKLYFEASIAYHQQIGDIYGTSLVCSNIGAIAHELGNYGEAIEYYQKALTLQRKLSNNIGIASTLSNLGVVAQEQGDYEEAIEWHERSLKLWKNQGEQRGIAVCLCSLGQVALYTHNYTDAQAKLKASLQLFNEQQELRTIAIILEAFGGLAVETANPAWAARLLGAAQHLRDSIKAPLLPGKLKRYNYYLNKLHSQLHSAESENPNNFKTFWDEGYAMGVDTAVKYVLGLSD